VAVDKGRSLLSAAFSIESGMTDWTEIAKARGVHASPKELEAMAEVLAALERSFAPLVREIPLETEPAAVFRAGAE
ncbi:MAG TPA: hypothetical protein VHA11_10600, partial [Bryobacteraceae bacterium]|nr:hypothetical protein [Bryobacteraceae bacterium]